MAMVVVVSSLAGLEKKIVELSSGDLAPTVRVRVGRVDDLFEAAPLLCRLRKLVADSDGMWAIEGSSVAALLQASEYYQKLDLLELHLDLMRLDLEEGVAMGKIRFDGVRRTSNEVVANAHPASIHEVLDNITVEGQRIARLANLLGFGGADVEDATLIDDDVEWFLSSVVDTGETEAEVPFDDEKAGFRLDEEAGVPFWSGEGALSSRVDALHLGLGVSEGKIASSADPRSGRESLGGARDREAGAHHLGHGNSNAKSDLKEEVTKGVLLRKITCLSDVLQKAKRSSYAV